MDVQPGSRKRPAEEGLSGPFPKKQKQSLERDDDDITTLHGLKNCSWNGRVPSLNKRADDLENFTAIANLAIKYLHDPDSELSLLSTYLANSCVAFFYDLKIKDTQSEFYKKIREKTKEFFRLENAPRLCFSENQSPFFPINQIPSIFDARFPFHDPNLPIEDNLLILSENYCSQYQSEERFIVFNHKKSSNFDKKIEVFFLYHEKQIHSITLGQLDFFREMSTIIRHDPEAINKFTEALTSYLSNLLDSHFLKMWETFHLSRKNPEYKPDFSTEIALYTSTSTSNTYQNQSLVGEFDAIYKATTQLTLKNLIFLSLYLEEFISSKNPNPEIFKNLQKVTINLKALVCSFDPWETLPLISFQNVTDKESQIKAVAKLAHDVYFLEQCSGLMSTSIFENCLSYIFRQSPDEQKKLLDSCMEEWKHLPLYFMMFSCGNGYVANENEIENLASISLWFRNFQKESNQKPKECHEQKHISKKQFLEFRQVAFKENLLYAYYLEEPNDGIDLDKFLELVKITVHFSCSELIDLCCEISFKLLKAIRDYFNNENKALGYYTEWDSCKEVKLEELNFIKEIKSNLCDQLELLEATPKILELQYELGIFSGVFLDSLKTKHVKNIIADFKKINLQEVSIKIITAEMWKNNIFQNVKILHLKDEFTGKTLEHLSKMKMRRLEHLVFEGTVGTMKNPKAIRTNFDNTTKKIEYLLNNTECFPKLKIENIEMFGLWENFFSDWKQQRALQKK